VVAAPALGLTYYATQSGGAFRLKDGARPEPIHVQPTHEPPVVVGSRSHRGDSLDGVLQRLGNYDLKPMGSALKFCLVAEGSADFYPRLGPTSEWDTAAAQAVLETAGGVVCGLDGLPLRYNERPTLLNPNFLAYGDASRNWLGLL
jgi:3'(2'), 5'-bisphosphate nucleotidase